MLYTERNDLCNFAPNFYIARILLSNYGIYKKQLCNFYFLKNKTKIFMFRIDMNKANKESDFCDIMSSFISERISLVAFGMFHNSNVAIVPGMATVVSFGSKLVT